MEAMLATRIPKFITEFSKNEAKKLIQAREDYYRQKMQEVLKIDKEVVLALFQ